MRKTKLFSLVAAALLTATTAWAAVAVNGKLPNAFSVSATKVVYFSQGNLQYTKSTGKWKIMDHQYDMVETLSQNVGTDYADQDVVTLFGWGTSGWESDTRMADFPYYTNNNGDDYGVLAPESSTETLTDATTNGEKGDWGVFNSGDLGAGWRTLTNAEWGYLFNTRTPGNSVNGDSNARYTEATINTDGTAVNGIILFPDDADMTSVSGVTWGSINSSSAWGTKCTSAGWTALETAGCVFLPAAGVRNGPFGESVEGVGSFGFYWSSSASSAWYAYSLFFLSGYVDPQYDGNRCFGCSVRLVTETAPAPQEQEIFPNADPQHAGVYYSTFYDSANKYALPEGVEAYVATRDGANLLLSQIAIAGQTIPADNAVILKSTVSPFTLTPSDAEAVPVNAINSLQGSDDVIATPDNCYVLAGTDGVVGFYRYTAANLNAHKAFVIYTPTPGQGNAPKRMPFIFDQATGVDQITNDQSPMTNKVIKDGVLYIEKNGVRYNAQGQIIK